MNIQKSDSLRRILSWRGIFPIRICKYVFTEQGHSIRLRYVKQRTIEYWNNGDITQADNYCFVNMSQPNIDISP